MFGSGIDVLAGLPVLKAEGNNVLRRIMLMSASIVYFTRIIWTGSFLQRHIAWNEAVMVAVLFYVLYANFLFWEEGILHLLILSALLGLRYILLDPI